MVRSDGRQWNEIRAVQMTPHINPYAEGSVLIEVGATKVICTATIDEKVPSFMKGQGRGWVTAEYAMLPRATQVRNQRESIKGSLGGRTMEIQRLIGRALRSVVDLHALGERTITLDCDVIQADGGTRTTSITGAFVALAFAIHKLQGLGVGSQGRKYPLHTHLAALSVGVIGDQVLLDLNYQEDSKATVDMNVVMTSHGKLVEVQGTGEEAPFSREQLTQMLDVTENGIRQLIEIQRSILGPAGHDIGLSGGSHVTTR
jgi:ribonuclease PH